MRIIDNVSITEKYIENSQKIYNNGAVTTELKEASDIGVNILKNGGNAVDAAIATSLAVGIINSYSSGIGGGGFMLVKMPDNQDGINFYDFRESAPAKIKEEMLLKNKGSTTTTGLSIAIPGEIRGMYDVHKKHGKLEWSELFKECIELAKKFKVSKKLADKLKTYEDSILKDPGMSKIYAPQGKILVEGETVKRENYAKTLEILSKNPESFYSGEIAKKIIKKIQSEDGVIEMDDLINYKTLERPVITGTYRDYTVYTASLPTSGPLLIQALNILEALEINEDFKNINNSLDKYHVFVEILKFLFAKRGELGDPEFINGWENIVKELISKKNASIIAKKIKFSNTLDTIEYESNKMATEDHGTTHINVMDKDDMIVSYTTTINHAFGSKIMDEETGIIFNNEIDDFGFENLKNYYNLEIVGENTIKPNKRPLSSASPVILTKCDETLVLGGVGGTRILSSTFYTLYNLFLGNSMTQAILEPRVHHQFTPMKVFVDRQIDADVIEYLKKRGHEVSQNCKTDASRSSVYAIKANRDKHGNKSISAYSDPNKGGEASGY